MKRRLSVGVGQKERVFNNKDDGALRGEGCVISLCFSDWVVMGLILPAN